MKKRSEDADYVQDLRKKERDRKAEQRRKKQVEKEEKKVEEQQNIETEGKKQLQLQRIRKAVRQKLVF